MTALHFAAPQWIHLLWVVFAFILLLAWLEQRSQRDLGQLIALVLQQRLVVRSTPLRRRLRLLFLALCGVFLTLALMRPQGGLQIVAMPKVGAEIMVCLDVSRSMLAEDVAPNRLERAKAELRDLLPYLDGDRVGLIAFAGRAVVLSPLTPDFSFFRLVLDEANPQSVARGGTRLEEPIRKAIAGFADHAEAARSIILITDGEDQDSFPLEAAKEAAERGIRILAIGFGDEAGSSVVITDPQTGGRSLLHDADGNLVQSRLDGALLREIALLTEGAYIPAGTGMLDLESIYTEHIATLTRGQLDQQTQRIRHDLFQWPLLLGLLCLLLAVMSPVAGAVRPQPALLVFGVLLITLISHSAQTIAAEEATELPPRTAYNQALAHLKADELDAAADLFATARNQAGTDSELRFSASYQLGWLEAKRADSLLETEPQTALQALTRATDWFREAIRLRPQQTESRHNLEVVLNRILRLTDQLSQQQDLDLKKQLQQLITQERTLLTELGATMDLVALQTDPDAIAAARRPFRAYGSRQLELLADAESVSHTADQQKTLLEAKTTEERTPEEAMRLAQITQLLPLLHRAREAMGQARGQLRRLQAERAYRRIAIALDHLKRARDQLLEPVARLDALLLETAEIIKQTSQKAALDEASEQQKTFVWLTTDYLETEQQALTERTQALTQLLEATLAQAQQTSQDQQQARLKQQLQLAVPLLNAGHEHFAAAQTALNQALLDEALDAQRQGLAKLLAAREHFLDLPRLVELLYQDEQRIAALLETEDNLSPALQLQQRNQRRLQQVAELIANQLVDVLETQEQQDETDEQASQAEQQRLAQADQLRVQAQQAMQQALQAIEQTQQDPDTLPQASQAVEQTVDQLDALRRLFFSLLDHLKELLQQQLDLSDRTEAATVLAATATPDEIAQQFGPLASEQDSLAELAQTLADALNQQEQQQPTPTEEDQAAIEKQQQAAEHLTNAQAEMKQAKQGMTAESIVSEAIRPHQNQAAEEISQAIALLQPPSEKQSQQNEQEQNQAEQQQQQQQQPENGEQQNEQQAQPADFNQLLQRIRDREAQRRQQHQQSQQQGYTPVEKDW